MGGFTLYETLRILVPGVVTTFALDFALRVGFGPQIFGADGGVEAFLDFVESTAGFTAFSLIAGLLLYMIDLPVKIRVFEGDAKRGWKLPSDTLADMMKGNPRKADALSLYFTLTDQYLPEEMRKRVYLVGSLFRIYVDLRAVAVLVFVTSVAASEVAAGRTTAVVETSIPRAGFLAAGALAMAVIAVGLYGVRRHTHAYRDKHGSDAAPPFARQSWRVDLRGALGPTAALGTLGGTGAFLLAVDAEGAQVTGAVFALAQAGLWLALEVGPPREDSSQTLRERMVAVLGGRRKDVQYAPIQRLLYDLFTFLPWLIAAAGVSAALGRDPAGVLAWSVLVVPPAVVVSFRKHEKRLLGIYKEQSVWLEMHKEDVEKLKETDLLPDRWQ